MISLRITVAASIIMTALVVLMGGLLFFRSDQTPASGLPAPPAPGMALYWGSDRPTITPPTPRRAPGGKGSLPLSHRYGGGILTGVCYSASRGRPAITAGFVLHYPRRASNPG